MRINSSTTTVPRSAALFLIAAALAVATACAPATESENEPDNAAQTDAPVPSESTVSPCVPPEVPDESSGLRSRARGMGQGDLVRPVQISTELPEYTPEATAAGIEGDVYIEAVVTTDGNVVEPVLIRGLPDDEVNCRALVAITKWKFKPATSNGEPVNVTVLFTVTFRVD